MTKWGIRQYQLLTFDCKDIFQMKWSLFGFNRDLWSSRKWNPQLVFILGPFWSFYCRGFPYGNDGWAGAWFSWGRGQVTDSLYQRHVGVTEGSSREVTVDILSYLWQSMIISDEVPMIYILIHRKHLWCKAQTAPVNTLNRKPQQKHCS